MEKQLKPTWIKVKGKAEDRVLLKKIADKLKGQELFPEKNARAKKMLSNLKSLPI
jgi:hypothetical protein